LGFTEPSRGGEIICDDLVSRAAMRRRVAGNRIATDLRTDYSAGRKVVGDEVPPLWFS